MTRNRRQPAKSDPRAGEVTVISYESLRSDWYSGGEYMARLLRRAYRVKCEGVQFCFEGFPRQWLPLFELLGVGWHRSVAPRHYVPLLGSLSQEQMLAEIAKARACGQLRLLAEIAASADIVVAEALQRLDLDIAEESDAEAVEASAPIRLTTWHAYSRAEIRRYERELDAFSPTKRQAAFVPCGRTRPYDRSPTHIRLRRQLTQWGVPLDQCDIIVITSLGPVPQQVWRHPTVLRYDTGVRDIYRMLVLFRRMMAKSTYAVGYDCLGFRPYRDLLRLATLEGFIGELRRPGPIRGRSIPAYRLP